MTRKLRSRHLARRAGKESLTKSQQMARVRSHNTEAELLLRKALWKKGLRFRVTYRTLPGSPDVAFTRWKIAIFVDGCFWHGCPVHYTSPKANSEFWKQKKMRNRARDVRVDNELNKLGWTVVRFWEHEVYETTESVVYSVLDVLIAKGKAPCCG